MAESTKTLKNKWKINDFAPQSFPFPHRFLIKISCLFQTPSKTSFFRPLAAKVHQKVAVLNFLGRFWHPLGFSGVHKIYQNRTFNVKKLPFSQRCARLFADLFQRSFSKRSGHHFGRFWMDLGWLFMDFGIILKCISEHFFNKICRSPTSPNTKRINCKHQEHVNWGNPKNRQELTKTKS